MLFSSPKIYHVCQEALHAGVRTHRPMFRTHLTGDLPPPPPVALYKTPGICHPMPSCLIYDHTLAHPLSCAHKKTYRLLCQVGCEYIKPTR